MITILITVISVLTIQYLYKTIRIKNPIKTYIRKEVVNYLKELQK
jgi:hypothetical protein